VFTGVKMITGERIHISRAASVGVIGLVLGVTAAMSLWPRPIAK
jgi:hypothetical protein